MYSGLSTASHLGTWGLSAMHSVGIVGDQIWSRMALSWVHHILPVHVIFLVLPVLTIPVPHTLHVCVPRTPPLYTYLSLLSPCDNLGYHLAFSPSLGSNTV